MFGGKCVCSGGHSTAKLFASLSKRLETAHRKAQNDIAKGLEKDAIAWAVGVVSPEEIDEINILKASFLAMHRAIDQLKVCPEALIIDGNRFTPYQNLPYTPIVKGDSKYLSIAAASILAKTYRDEYMEELHSQYPQYEWSKNKGYPTVAHREAIKKYGQRHFIECRSIF